MAKIAFLFPGQGSQKIGMGLALFEDSKRAREIFEHANEALSFSLTDIMFHGAESELLQTEVAQPAILTHSIAMLETLREEGAAEPDFVAGHSLGEYSALVAAGVLSFADAVRAVHLRGKYMQAAVPVGVGSMAAVLGLDVSIIEDVCVVISSESNELCVEVANYNGPDQTVISGTYAGVAKAMQVLKEKGAKRVVPLPVSAPFHSKLMRPAALQLAEHLNTLTFHAPRCAFVNNVRADLEDDPERIRQLLIEQVVAPVRFTQMLKCLEGLDVRTYVEIGPGKVLSGITRRTLSNVDVTSKETHSNAPNL